MEFYVAGRFGRKDEVREVYEKLKKAGHTVTADWTLHKPIQPYSQNQEMSASYADEDMEGVRKSDIFLMLADAEKSSGIYVELGIAMANFLAFGKPKIFVVGESPSMFSYHPAVNRRNSVEEVLSEVKNVREK